MKRIFQFSHCTLHLYRKKIILFSVLSIGLVPTQSIYDTTYTYDFYDAGTYLDCSVGCYFGVVGASEPIWWSATTQVTIPNL